MAPGSGVLRTSLRPERVPGALRVQGEYRRAPRLRGLRLEHVGLGSRDGMGVACARGLTAGPATSIVSKFVCPVRNGDAGDAAARAELQLQYVSRPTIARAVIELKNELERVREQIANVE